MSEVCPLYKPLEILCVCVLSSCVPVSPCIVCSTQGDQRRALEPLKKELPANCHVVLLIEPGASGRGVSVFNF